MHNQWYEISCATLYVYQLLYLIMYDLSLKSNICLFLNFKIIYFCL